MGERTMRATLQAIRYEQLEPLTLKGKSEPVAAWEAAGLVTAQPGGRETWEESPLVGRDDELGVLESVFTRISRERSPHMVTLVGEAGVGKSRLLREFEAPDRRGAAPRCAPAAACPTARASSTGRWAR